MVYIVYSGDDSGAGTLREGITDITESIIEIQVPVVTLDSGELYIDRDLTIYSSVLGGSMITRDSSDNFRILHLDGNIQVFMTDLTISGGVAENDNGGGIFLENNANLSLNHCIVTNNSVTGTEDFGFGGGIYGINSVLNLNQTTVSSNNSTTVAGGIYLQTSNLNITYSNIYLNSSNIAGGIYVLLCNEFVMSYSSVYSNICNNNGAICISNTPFTITHSTIYQNFSNSGGGAGITAFGNTGNSSRIVNSTFESNISTNSNGAGGILTNTTMTLISVTIANNYSQGQGGGIRHVISMGSVVNISNTIIANNTSDTGSRDVSGVFNSLGYNFIGIDQGSTGFGAIGDQVGTLISPIDPMLGPLYNNGGPTLTMALLPGSPAINTGDPSFDIGDPWDQRGNPYSRITNGKVDIGAFEVQPFICYSGESQVLTKNKLTHVITEINAEDVKPNIHEVFDVDKQKFVPIISNIVTGPITQFRLIKANSLGENKPNRDLYITSAHRIIIDGKRMKAKDAPNSIRINVPPQNVYCICTQKKCSIQINGIAVATWDYDKWLEYSQNLRK